jgi:hypothetical protein
LEELKKAMSNVMKTKMSSKPWWLLGLTVATMIIWIYAAVLMANGHAPMLSSLEHPVLAEHHTLEAHRNHALLSLHLQQQQQQRRQPPPPPPPPLPPPFPLPPYMPQLAA